MTVLFEAYIHYRHGPVSEDALRALARRTLALTKEGYASAGLTFPVTFEAYAEEGSLKQKGWALLQGPAIIAFLIKYGDIRSGILGLVDDARTAAHYVVDHVRMAERISDTDIVSSRAKAPLAEKLRKVFKQVESGSLSAEEGARQVERLLADTTQDAQLLSEFSDKFRITSDHYHQMVRPYMLPKLPKPEPAALARVPHEPPTVEGKPPRVSRELPYTRPRKRRIRIVEDRDGQQTEHLDLP